MILYFVCPILKHFKYSSAFSNKKFRQHFPFGKRVHGITVMYTIVSCSFWTAFTIPLHFLVLPNMTNQDSAPFFESKSILLILYFEFILLTTAHICSLLITARWKYIFYFQFLLIFTFSAVYFLLPHSFTFFHLFINQKCHFLSLPILFWPTL